MADTTPASHTRALRRNTSDGQPHRRARAAICAITAAAAAAAGATAAAHTDTSAQPVVAAAGALATVIALLVCGHALLIEHTRANMNAWQATHDTRTGLPNREHLTNHFNRHFDRRHTQRNQHNTAETTTTVVAYFDLDGFKHVNDTYGHDTGDQLVEAVARRLRSNLDANTLLARIGGDEFIAATTINHPVPALDNTAHLDDVAAHIDTLVKQISANVNRRHRLGDNSTPTTAATSAAIGIAAGNGNGNELLANAEIAMYHAKRLGGGQHAIYDNTMHAATSRRRHIETLLRDTTNVTSRIHAEYQPIINMNTGAITGYEALARWHNPNETISPDEFITIAEDTGIINIIGEQILDEACAQLAAWRTERANRHLTISVNISARQLESDTIVTGVQHALQRHQLPGNALTLEITESLLMNPNSAKVERLHALRALGVRIAIDDFGTGYSSLSYLKDLPIDAIKIDRAFISDSNSARGRQMLEAICAMAHILQLTCVGEGVETADQQTALIACGCELGQGFLYAEARPGSAIDAERDAAA